MMSAVYGIFVFLHVVSAVIAIGPLFLLLPIIRRLRGADSQAEEAYLTVIRVTIRGVMHAGHALVITGVLLLILGPWPWHASWVILTMIVLLLSAVYLSRGFTQVLRKFHELETNKNDIIHRLSRTTWTYIGLMLIILWLMVQKPMIW